ncbi:hypothetical protein ASC84_00685 [Acinetobacter sp. Root1280]|uniref:hypothetical protein n=1 Tax=Acinetobacter sp. Root1280 TaxID=1736444 RepID=UPI0006FECF63|nr:hypothetical protein [Acinetobacter sp. Root1280]KQX03253.1 hypothetical protein ASC84_00685 [Acinetobacter sp. Root1280]
MNNLDIQIQNMQSGDSAWIGSGYNSNEMQSIHHYLQSLENERVIQIVIVHRESTSGLRLVDRVKIEKL